MIATDTSTAGPRVGYVLPVLTGLLVAAAGLIPWVMLGPMIARKYPNVPWAALAMTAYISLLLAWLHGRGWPKASSQWRRRRLRLWPPTPDHDGAAGSLTAWSIVLLLVLLYVFWIIIGRLSPTPDLTAFPSTTMRWSMFIMGGALSGIVEEAAYRGYMQTGLEEHDPDRAIVITSAVFAVSHITHGWQALLLLGPGLFVVSVLFGLLARRTGTILPGIVIHVVGDLSYTFFGVLRGDVRFLFVP